MRPFLEEGAETVLCRRTHLREWVGHAGQPD